MNPADYYVKLLRELFCSAPGHLNRFAGQFCQTGCFGPLAITRFAPKYPADKGRDHAHIIRRKTQDVRYSIFRPKRRLRKGPYRGSTALNPGNRGYVFQWPHGSHTRRNTFPQTTLPPAVRLFAGLRFVR